MKAGTQHQIQLGRRRVDYRLIRSPAARKLRVRVGLNGVEVVLPAARRAEDVAAFLNSNEAWISDQLRRVEQLRSVRRPEQGRGQKILFRGEPTHIRIERAAARWRGNVVSFVDGEIVIRRGSGSRTPVARSLESWLRTQARAAIEVELGAVTSRLGERPTRIYVMGQRTKWGNCSRLRNLSFNWRLILAPGFVLRYLVTHEAVHLAVPDHSAKFWLTVQSLCPETERAKQWLCARAQELAADLQVACLDTREGDVKQ
jgi:predicted metal-dependent hydrolase